MSNFDRFFFYEEPNAISCKKCGSLPTINSTSINSFFHHMVEHVKDHHRCYKPPIYVLNNCVIFNEDDLKREEDHMNRKIEEVVRGHEASMKEYCDLHDQYESQMIIQHSYNSQVIHEKLQRATVYFKETETKLKNVRNSVAEMEKSICSTDGVIQALKHENQVIDYALSQIQNQIVQLNR